VLLERDLFRRRVSIPDKPGLIARHHNDGELIGYGRNPAAENLIRRKRP